MSWFQEAVARGRGHLRRLVKDPTKTFLSNIDRNSPIEMIHGEEIKVPKIRKHHHEVHLCCHLETLQSCFAGHDAKKEAQKQN